MAGATDGEQSPPSAHRMIIAALIVLAVVLGAWKIIDFRSQPPPPPHPVGALVNP